MQNTLKCYAFYMESKNIKNGFLFRLVLIGSIGMLSACGLISKKGSSDYSQQAREIVGSNREKLDKSEMPALTSEVSARPVIQISGPVDPKSNEIPLAYNRAVEKWITYFTTKNKSRFQRFINRGEQYRPYIQAVLADNDLPTDLYYLAMIESGFVIHARSHASAVGVWQFMKGTGRDYGLQVDRYVDERKDHLQATEAAASYLRDLYNTLGSWDLAVAAYNCGENRVRRVVRRGRTRNFWKLAQRKLLPLETRDYVPKFMAAIIIGKNPEKFGFTRPTETSSVELSRVRVPGAVKLSTISSLGGVKLSVLKKHNPHLRRLMTPRNKRSYEIWVPKKLKGIISAKYDYFLKLRSKRVARSVEAKAQVGRWHKVRRGQTLSGIARKYGVSVSYLKRINQLKSGRIYKNQQILVSAPRVGKKKYHVVQSGQTLSGLASRYGKSVKSLKRLNGLRRTRLYVGQRLKIQNDSYTPKKASQKAVSAWSHKVRRGESLARIARKYGTSVVALQRSNGLRGAKIVAGQRLKIPRNQRKAIAKVRIYKVKRGDSLVKIAKRFGISSTRLKRLNGIRGSKILAGQKLRIIR